MADVLVIPGIAEFKNFVGVPFGPSDWIDVTQERIDRFAEATGDHQWIHVDPERARRDSPFDGTIAHGYLTLALAPALLPQIIRIDGLGMAVNYGIEKMRLPKPVPAGGRLRLAGEIKHVRSVPGGAARVTFALKFQLEGATRSACTADAVYVYFPSP